MKEETHRIGRVVQRKISNAESRKVMHRMGAIRQRIGRGLVVVAAMNMANLQTATAATDTLRLETTGTLRVERTTLATPETVDEDAMLLEMVAQQSQQLHANDTAWQVYVSPLCLPLIYIPEPLRTLRDTAEDTRSLFAIRQQARRYITTHCANLYTGVSNPQLLADTELKPIRMPRALVPDDVEDKLDAARILRDQRSNWRKEANISLQITQNYATENWYQGGVNTFAMLGSIKAFANYKRGKFSWENTGEWRAGFSTVSGDSLRHLNTTDDIFRLFSKVGYQVHPKWYMSLSTEFRTNFWTVYKKNKHVFTSSFLTPIRFTVGAGVDYQPLNGLNINLSPAAYKLVYALRYDPNLVDVTEYGIESGKNLLSEFGSSVRVDWKWKPLREIEMETNFYFFTNYRRIETELEVNFNFIINRYLSAKLMLHPRYDSSTEIKPGRKSKIQFKEFISVGFAHTFR